MNLVYRMLIPVVVLQMLACSDTVGEPSADGSGGNTPGETSSSSSGGADTDPVEDPLEDGSAGGPSAADTSSAWSGAGGGPVACHQGEGAPPGAPCAVEGESCDYACSPCWVTCTDGLWVEQCTTCPSEPPEDGADCSDFAWLEPCSYGLECGRVTASCDVMTGLWVVDKGDCDEEEVSDYEGQGCF